MAALTSFYDWLIKQKNLRTSLGGFARESTRDSAFPRDVASLDALLEYLQATPGRSPQAIAVARAAYRTYERTHAPAIRG
jgi:uncharacterized protein YozE (UPF0346 family)